MSGRTLLLTPWMAPHKVISWQAAVTLFYLKKVHVLEEYEDVLTSPSQVMKMPAVVVLTKPLDARKRAVKFSRINVFTRDGFRCQYCGERKEMRELNYDHVLPRIRGGRTVWDNIVTACYPCNDRKGSKTVAEAGMTLRRKPFKPTSLPLSFLQIDRRTMPEIWEPYCKGANIEEDHKGLFLLTG